MDATSPSQRPGRSHLRDVSKGATLAELCRSDRSLCNEKQAVEKQKNMYTHIRIYTLSYTSMARLDKDMALNEDDQKGDYTRVGVV